MWTKMLFTSQKCFEDFLKLDTFSCTVSSVFHSLEGFLVRVAHLFPQGKLCQSFSMDRETSSPLPARTLPQAATQICFSQTAHITTCLQLCPDRQQSSQTPSEMKRWGARKPFPNHCRNAGKTSVSQDNSVSLPSFWNIPVAQKKKRQVLRYLLLMSDGVREEGALPTPPFTAASHKAQKSGVFQTSVSTSELACSDLQEPASPTRPHQPFSLKGFQQTLYRV